MSDTAVLWTWERLMEKTEAVCFHVGTQMANEDGTAWLEGWFMKEWLFNDICERLECLN